MWARKRADCRLGSFRLQAVTHTWALWLTEVKRRIMPYFTRREARHRVWASLRGLLSPIERKNG